MTYTTDADDQLVADLTRAFRPLMDAATRGPAFVWHSTRIEDGGLMILFTDEHGRTWACSGRIVEGAEMSFARVD